MVARDDFAAQWAGGMPGGPKNPLGARALYLYQGNVDTLYRIHGTFAPSSIGKAVSSGCIRMINSDVADLYDRVPVGTKVVVVQGRRISTDEEDIAPKKRKRRFLFSSNDEE
jgi:lipoprotein-anchoring transpeptidase ErfK/SrfK